MPGALYIREGIEEKAELKRLFDPAELGNGPLIDPQISEDGSLAPWSHNVFLSSWMSSWNMSPLVGIQWGSISLQ